MSRCVLLRVGLVIGLAGCSDPKPAEPGASQPAAQEVPPVGETGKQDPAGELQGEQPAAWSLARFERECREYLTEQTRQHNREWGIGKATRWDADLEKGFITWTFADKVIRAPVQVIGTYNPLEQSLLWGWDHPSVPRELAKDARTLRNWGKEHHLKPLTHRQIICSESEVWTYVAMAAKLAGANGAYRGTTEQVLIFFTFGKLIIEDRTDS